MIARYQIADGFGITPGGHDLLVWKRRFSREKTFFPLCTPIPLQCHSLGVQNGYGVL